VRSTRFLAALDEARASGRVLLDLAVSDPGRCGLGWDAGELDAMLERRRGRSATAAASEAREAIAGYLAGHGASVSPDRVVPVRSSPEALRLAIDVLCEGGGEALVPVPQRPLAGAGSPADLRGYALVFGERWSIDRRSLRRAVSSRTRAVLVGNPADPTGAELSREDLAFLERLCEARGLALLGDEAWLDASREPSVTVASALRCLAVHASGLGGICGLPELEAAWLAVTGPEVSAHSLASRLASLAPPASARGVLLAPPLLGRREAFLSRLRARLARNRSALATASLREAPWTMQWGGGIWAVLQLNADQDEDALCLALLEEGIAIQPGHLAGFPGRGYAVVSLLPEPAVFDAALGRIEAQLRRPPSAPVRA
jgi:aspartate/methionine/tyrosine aminotransferase